MTKSTLKTTSNAKTNQTLQVQTFYLARRALVFCINLLFTKNISQEKNVFAEKLFPPCFR
jgi:hypothetical protein